jgi:RNA-splicing ligase RtcB
MNPHLPRQLAYLEGPAFDDYLHDMKIIQHFALLNRKAMVDEIRQSLGLTVDQTMTTIHNYIDLEAMILRKGAISARKGERVLIPMNMRDGSLLCLGLGNKDWNESAPHGAGRIMSRSQARKTLSLGNLRRMMEGVYTSSISQDTLDESPEAYKPMEELLGQIGETVQVESHLRPLYNFKAKE